MKVYYSKGWAITFVIAGLILIGLNFFLFSLTGSIEATRVIPGLMVIIVGILYFFQPYFKLEEKSLVTYSLLGFAAWRYRIDSISDLSFDGTKLFRNHNGKFKRIRISKFVCDKEQWENSSESSKVQNLETNYMIDYLANGTSLMIISGFSQTPDSRYSSCDI